MAKFIFFFHFGKKESPVVEQYLQEAFAFVSIR